MTRSLGILQLSLGWVLIVVGLILSVTVTSSNAGNGQPFGAFWLGVIGTALVCAGVVSIRSSPQKRHDTDTQGTPK